MLSRQYARMTPLRKPAYNVKPLTPAEVVFAGIGVVLSGALHRQEFTFVVDNEHYYIVTVAQAASLAALNEYWSPTPTPVLGIEDAEIRFPVC